MNLKQMGIGGSEDGTRNKEKDMNEEVTGYPIEQHTPEHVACPVCARINARIGARTREEIVALVEREMRHGDPRSHEYRLGVVDLICRRVLDTPLPPRYQMGSVQADAYYAGVDRGWSIWRKLGEKDSQ